MKVENTIFNYHWYPISKNANVLMGKELSVIVLSFSVYGAGELYNKEDKDH